LARCPQRDNATTVPNPLFEPEEEKDLEEQVNMVRLDVSTDHFYWRETLSRRMESLQVNFLVILLIFIDIGNVLYQLIYYEEESNSQPVEQIALAYSVLSLFVLELMLRILAQRRRFFRRYFQRHHWFHECISNIHRELGRLVFCVTHATRCAAYGMYLTSSLSSAAWLFLLSSTS